MLNYQRYERVPMADFPGRTQPNKEIMKVPVWCSVDLRDGNQALVEPMVVEGKVEMFNLLMKLSLKEIEVSFPIASQIEHDFLRTLVERKLILDDTKVQVLVQHREHLIKRTFEALESVRKAIVYIYSSTSALQRDVAFHKDREDIKDMAVMGVRMVQRCMTDCDIQIRLKRSPESLIDIELDSALDIYTAVRETWGVTRENPIITNLPSTMEMTIPNVYADQTEWMNTHFKNRKSITLSIHPYNGREEDAVSTKLVLPAGTDRVRGTLFGNGRRTNSVNMLIIAYSTFSQGISPRLNIGNIREIADTRERCIKMGIPPKHPYTGKLVPAAFSGFHQDAINKDIQALHKRNGQYQEAPYLPIDPNNVGREYESIVRINNQFGKDDVALVMDTLYGFKLPKGTHKKFADVIQKISERQGEVIPEQIMEEFKKNYLECKEPIHFRKRCITDTETGDDEFAALVKVTYSSHGIERTFEGVGDGPVDAVQRGIEDVLGVQIKVLDYSEHTLVSGSGAETTSCTHLANQVTGKTIYGVGISSNITGASLRGIFSAMSRLLY